MNDTNGIFKISTLRDIFELPTFGQMNVLLYELTNLMIQARAVNDFMLESAKSQGSDAKKAFNWPDSIEWTDDGKGDITTNVSLPNGEDILEMQSNIETYVRFGPEWEAEMMKNTKKFLIAMLRKKLTETK